MVRPASRDQDNPFARQNKSLDNAGKYLRGLGNALMPVFQKLVQDSGTNDPKVAIASNAAPKKPGEGGLVDVKGK